MDWARVFRVQALLADDSCRGGLARKGMSHMGLSKSIGGLGQIQGTSGCRLLQLDLKLHLERICWQPELYQIPWQMLANHRGLSMQAELRQIYNYRKRVSSHAVQSLVGRTIFATLKLRSSCVPHVLVALGRF